MALLQRPSVGEAALGIMLSVSIAWGMYKPSDNYMLHVDLAEYFKLRKHYNTAAYNRL